MASIVDIKEESQYRSFTGQITKAMKHLSTSKASESKSEAEIMADKMYRTVCQS